MTSPVMTLGAGAEIVVVPQVDSQGVPPGLGEPTDAQCLVVYAPESPCTKSIRDSGPSCGQGGRIVEELNPGLR